MKRNMKRTFRRLVGTLCFLSCLRGAAKFWSFHRRAAGRSSDGTIPMAERVLNSVRFVSESTTTINCAAVTVMIMEPTTSKLQAIASGSRLPCEIVMPKKPSFAIPANLQPHVNVIAAASKGYLATRRNKMAEASSMPVIAVLENTLPSAKWIASIEETLLRQYPMVDFLLFRRCGNALDTMDEESDVAVVPIKLPSSSATITIRQLLRWVCCSTEHAPWDATNIVIRRTVWLGVKQRKEPRNEESLRFIVDLLQNEYQGLFFNQSLTGNCGNPEKHATVQQLQLNTAVGAMDCAKITVMVPLTADRISLISQLLESVAQGTRVPCEIIFSISSYLETTIMLDIPARLKEHSNITVLLTADKKTAPAHRNQMAKIATMPILASLDSDDLSGHLRMESIEKTFQLHPEYDFMVHKWFWCQDGEPKNQTLPTDTDFLSINAIFPQDIMTQDDAERWSCCHTPRRPPWTNGHIIVRQHVWTAVQQNEAKTKGEDSRFTADLLLAGYQGVFVNKPLTGYCQKSRSHIKLQIDDLQQYLQWNNSNFHQAPPKVARKRVIRKVTRKRTGKVRRKPRKSPASA